MALEALREAPWPELYDVAFTIDIVVDGSNQTTISIGIISGRSFASSLRNDLDVKFVAAHTSQSMGGLNELDIQGGVLWASSTVAGTA